MRPLRRHQLCVRHGSLHSLEVQQRAQCRRRDARHHLRSQASDAFGSPGTPREQMWSTLSFSASIAGNSFRRDSGRRIARRKRRLAGKRSVFSAAEVHELEQFALMFSGAGCQTSPAASVHCCRSCPEVSRSHPKWYHCASMDASFHFCIDHNRQVKSPNIIF